MAHVEEAGCAIAGQAVLVLRSGRFRTTNRIVVDSVRPLIVSCHKESGAEVAMNPGFERIVATVALRCLLDEGRKTRVRPLAGCGVHTVLDRVRP